MILKCQNEVEVKKEWPGIASLVIQENYVPEPLCYEERMFG